MLYGRATEILVHVCARCHIRLKYTGALLHWNCPLRTDADSLATNIRSRIRFNDHPNILSKLSNSDYTQIGDHATKVTHTFLSSDQQRSESMSRPRTTRGQGIFLDTDNSNRNRGVY